MKVTQDVLKSLNSVM